jgi:cell division protein FtsQ
VSVRRVWPDTVRIHVYEQQPVARWGDAELLNGQGEVFAIAGHEVSPELPQLQGPKGREQALLATYQQLADLLSVSQLRIARLHQDQRRALELTLITGVKVQLGRHDALARMRRFMRAYASLTASREQTLQRVDLRYSNGFAARWVQANGNQKS